MKKIAIATAIVNLINSTVKLTDNIIEMLHVYSCVLYKVKNRIKTYFPYDYFIQN